MTVRAPDLDTAPQIFVTCVSTEAEFLILESDWNRLLMESSRPVPFLTWEWISTWWQHFGANSRLFVIVARDEMSRVVGIAPLRLTSRKTFGMVPVRSLEFLGYRGSKVCADHLDFITGLAHRAEICSRLCGEVIRRCDEWDSLELADLAEDSLVPVLFTGIQQSADSVSSRPHQQCPYVCLPLHWEILLNSMKAKYRNNIKRRRERLYENFQVTFDSNCSTDRVIPHMEIMERLHGSSRSRKGEAGNFCLKPYRQFHQAIAERMAQSGWLYLARLDCNGSPVAALYGFYLGGRLFGYQTGFDAAWERWGVGAVLQARIFEDAIERLHATEYDFLRGTERYKYTWTNQERHTRTLRHWNNSLVARMAREEHAVKQRVAGLRSLLRSRVRGSWLRSSGKNTGEECRQFVPANPRSVQRPRSVADEN
jgi:CelD/BcsL family acetyltransferase involved in cellulose biosynthesis